MFDIHRSLVSVAQRTALFLALSAIASAQALVNGGSVTGSISTAGDADTYSFTALAGEEYQVRATDTGGGAFTPQIRIFNGGGTLLHSTWGASVASLSAAASAGGAFTVEIRDLSLTNTGPYKIEFARAPGANEGGPLTNGAAAAGVLDLGDLDSYTFAANAGDGLQLRVGDVAITALTPEISLYSPSGVGLNYTWGVDAASISTTALTSGVYTVVVGDRNLTGSGSYALHLVRAPGANEGGALPNGGSLSNTIDVGDLDSYSFVAGAGEDFQVRAGDLNAGAFTPELSVYSPTGALLAYTWSASVAVISNTAALSGTYTVVVGDRNLSGTGPYDIHFTRRPGANEGGTLPLGGSVSGVIDLGDLDSYTFFASWGQGFQIRAADLGLSALTPELAVYDPSGQLAHYTWAAATAVVTGAAMETGTYTVVVSDRNGSGTGAYDLHFARAPGANEGGTLPNSGVKFDTLTMGDLDSYTFAMSWGESINLRFADLAASAITPEMTLYGPAGEVAATTWTTDVARIAHTAVATGVYTVVVGDRNATGVGPCALYFARAPGANEGGLIPNGASLAGYFDRGDLDSFTLNATNGQIIQLSVSEGATPALTPEMFLYGPTGALVATTWAATAASINIAAPETGIYTLVVDDRNSTGVGLYGAGFTRDVQTYCTAGVSASGCTAAMSGVGDPSASASSGFHVLATGSEGDKDGLFFFGTSGRQALPWGNTTSLQCVASPVIRTPILDGVGTNSVCDGLFALDFNAFAAGLVLGAPAVGAQVQLQCWYRDPASSANLKTSLSNALEFTVGL